MPGVLTVTINPSLDTTARAERIEPDRKIRCSAVRHDPGGGGINVARAIHRLGGTATALWAVGGIFGRHLAKLLTDQEVDHDPVEIEGQTRQSFAVIEGDGGRHFRFSTPGPDLRADELDRILARAEQWAPELAVISGGLPPSVPADFYVRLSRSLASYGARVVVDTHGDPLQASLAEGAVFLAKPNYRELLTAAGLADQDRPDIAGAARRLIEEGAASAILVSLGTAGAVLVDGEGEDRIPAPTVPIRSRIGAGDSMVGGLVWRLACGDDLPTAARYAVAAGSAAVMSPGTELCRRDDVERLYTEISPSGLAAPNGG